MDQRIEYCIDAELLFARAKFPGSNLNFPALIEEVGELSKALLENSQGKVSGEQVFAEAIQVAVMAIRVAEEGSAEFSYKFDHSHYQKFDVNKWENHLKAIAEKIRKPTDVSTNGKSKSDFKLPEFKGKTNKISADFLRRFNGAGCQCGKQKLENYPLCARCFQRLPGEFRTALRQKKGGELEAVITVRVSF
ncbi:leucyl-tRNA synthetase [Biomphalaria pfeifferi]|uniref:Leucyl-tRNA synthetase n=1 Tax=Biomphalaria pfeifferi TaxID=112525 RepID=A0AAD8EUS4_BIOPF|nr:leucyl-tRNA synthetase [Biomphalaria pfeifferi]